MNSLVIKNVTLRDRPCTVVSIIGENGSRPFNVNLMIIIINYDYIRCGFHSVKTYTAVYTWHLNVFICRYIIAGK